jgi:hypothetical protein
MKILSSKLSRTLTSSTILAVTGIVTPAIADPWACTDKCAGQAQIDASNAMSSAMFMAYEQCGGNANASYCMSLAQSTAKKAATAAFDSSMSACVNQCYASV